MAIVPIPESDVEAARARIGRTRPVLPWHDRTTASAIWNFACALGDDNPLWWDEARAGASRWGGIVAPPSYFYSCTNGLPRTEYLKAPGETEDEPIFPGAAALWFGDSWTWDDLLRLDEVVHGTSSLESIEPRQRSNGETGYLVKSRTDFTGDGGRKLASLTRTMMYFGRDVQDQAPAASTKSAYTPPRYSDEEITGFVRAYEEEYGRRSGATSPAFEDVEVGGAVGPLLKGPLTLTGIVGWMMGWGSSLMVTNRLSLLSLSQNPGLAVRSPVTNIPDSWGAGHWDAAIARETGLPDGYDFGAQRIAWASHLLTDWVGDQGMLRSLSIRLKRPNLLGDTTTFTGSVSAKELVDDQTGAVTVTISAHNQRGIVTAEGDAVCWLPRRPTK